MLKIALILSAVSMTMSLTVHQNQPYESAHSFREEAPSTGGYYFVFETPEEDHHQQQPQQHSVYESRPHDGADSDGSQHRYESFDAEENHRDESVESQPRVEYILVRSSQDDDDRRGGDNGQSHYPEEHAKHEKKMEEKHFEYYEHPKYQYVYDVQDYHTGDVKTHHESRDGDAVQGWYSLLEPDGTILEVHYTADKENGFNARVDRKGKAMRQAEPRKKTY